MLALIGVATRNRGYKWGYICFVENLRFRFDAGCWSSFSRRQRMWRKQAEIEAKLAEDCSRPKGVRQATYRRLVDQRWELEMRRDDALAVFMAMHFERSEKHPS